PRNYMKIPTAANGPLFGCHNHDPAIVECPNGDLLTIWYTCASETGRELALAATRLPWDQQQWQPASQFWDAPDRNDHAPALWFDGKEKIYHFTGMSFGARHHQAALIMRTSSDSGATWSATRIILPEYNSKHKPCEPVFRNQDGAIVLASDWPNIDGYNASGLWISNDEGLTWTTPGGVIRGIHAGVVQLDNGCYLAYGRPEAWTLPKSLSCDMGKSFTYSDSQFPSVGGAQRNVLLRLKGGDLFLAGFADRGVEITDSAGNKRRVYGLYTAVSEDQGKTWPYIRLVTDDGPGRAVQCTDGGLFIMSQRNAEPRGYASVCQSLDGLIHLISSQEHYAFNLKWLKTAAPPVTTPSIKVKSIIETFTGPNKFDNEGWVDYRSNIGRFNGKGQYAINATTHHNGINHLIGKGSFELDLSIRNIHYNPVRGRVSEGLSLWIKDNRARFCSISFKEDHIKLEIRDIETSEPVKNARYREGFGWKWENKQNEYSKPPKTLRVKLTWNENSRRLRILYSFDGNEPDMELAKSKEGIYFGKPLTESTAIYLLMSNGQMDLDHLEIKTIKN
ncbi:MAG: exo-alpha-sialidase, partial [Planctomycetota bacterium]